MVILLILNIILIIALGFLLVYLFYNKKSDVKNICVKNDCTKDDECDDTKYVNNVKNKRTKTKPERVFEGRFITDEEYQQMKKNRRSELSILLEELDNEFEHLKKLNR